MSNSVYNTTIFVFIGFLLFVRADAMDVRTFFPDRDGNLTKITWAHAVNNRTHLKTALNSSVMMLEADVIYGKINGTGESIPIMGHPPATESDLSLKDFLTLTYQFNKDEKNRKVRKGVKLDFKSTDVFLKSIDLIKQLYNMIDYPVWLNADIIRGPLNAATIPVDPDSFLSKSKVFNRSVLSLGWTTTQPNENSFYTKEQIDNMVSVIRNNSIKQDITFAVRAGIAGRSLDHMKVLKETVSNCTLTVWSSEGDDVDVPKLRELIFEFGVQRVYIDVPEDLRDQLNLGSAAPILRAGFLLALSGILFFL